MQTRLCSALETIPSTDSVFFRIFIMHTFTPFVSVAYNSFPILYSSNTSELQLSTLRINPTPSMSSSYPWMIWISTDMDHIFILSSSFSTMRDTYVVRIKHDAKRPPIAYVTPEIASYISPSRMLRIPTATNAHANMMVVAE